MPDGERRRRGRVLSFGELVHVVLGVPYGSPALAHDIFSSHVRDVSFSDEQLHDIRRRQKTPVEYFDRSRTANDLVACPIDRREAAAATTLLDDVPTDPRADAEVLAVPRLPPVDAACR